MKRLRRIIFVFMAITVFVFVAGLIYHQFGRGVFSSHMAYAFLYPLFFGALFNLILLPVQSRLPFAGTVGYRLYSNLYNTGIGALTLHSFVMGVLEIAGAESPLTQYLSYFGWVCIAAGLCTLSVLLFGSITARKRYNQRKLHHKKGM